MNGTPGRYMCQCWRLRVDGSYCGHEAPAAEFVLVPFGGRRGEERELLPVWRDHAGLEPFGSEACPFGAWYPDAPAPYCCALDGSCEWPRCVERPGTVATDDDGGDDALPF